MLTFCSFVCLERDDYKTQGQRSPSLLKNASNLPFRKKGSTLPTKIESDLTFGAFVARGSRNDNE